MSCNPTPTPAMDVLEVPLLASQLIHASSEPTLNVQHVAGTGSNEELSTNVTRSRNVKRKMLTPPITSFLASDKLEVFMSEIRTMFSDFKEQENIKYEKILTAVEEIRSSVEFSAKKCEALECQVDQLEARHQNSVKHIKMLEARLDSLERSSRSTCLEIRNIPSSQQENKSSLVNTFIKTGKVLDVEIQPGEIKDIFRTYSKDPAARTIIVDLTSVLLREKVVAMFKKFNKIGSRLSTEHLNISGPAKPVFISENLTSKMKRLFYLAREFAKENQYSFCWVANGNIFLRKKEGAPLIRVTCEDDLVNCTTQK